MFAVAPFLIANAPYESTMGLVQKIFYFHVPSAMRCSCVGVRLRHRQRASISSAARRGRDRLACAAAELTVLFGLIGLVTGRSGRARRGASGGSGTRG